MTAFNTIFSHVKIFGTEGFREVDHSPVSVRDAKVFRDLSRKQKVLWKKYGEVYKSNIAPFT